MAKSTTPPEESLQDQLSKDATAAWEALQPLRATWDEKERALLAKTNDSFSGNVTRAKVTDAAMSTLSFERQARVAAQLPTGKLFSAGKADEGKSKLANIVLQKYIIPNANSQKDMLIKQRLWGVYASVYGSMPMFYDYRVDDQYIGPDCWLVDPRSFLPQPGRNSVQECDWVIISTIMTVRELKEIAKKDPKNTSWNIEAVNKLIKAAEDGKPSRTDDAAKQPQTSQLRYSSDAIKGQIEIMTKYENGAKGHWITFAPDYKEVPVLRDIPNPHKSGKIPVVLRDCFPLLNSIYGLGDFERGMKIQKAKDSLLSLRLEFVKNKVFPPLKVDTSKVTPSTIKYQSGAKWRMTDMNAVQAMTFGNDSEGAFQNTYNVLNGIQQDQYGTSNTTLNIDSAANPQYGKTPAAIQMQQQQQNARDTWDRFMHEKAVEELYEGMINLLAVKMEKPINFNVFEEEIRQIASDYPNEDILQVVDSGKSGRMTVTKSLLKNDQGYRFIIDGNSSMKQDDEAQLQALIQTYQMAAQDQNLQAVFQQQGIMWDQAEHFKKILIASGVSDWERILQEGQGGQGGQPDQEDPAMAQQEAMMQQEQQMAMQAQQEHAAAQEQLAQHPVFQTDDPEIQAYARQMLGGQ